MPKNKIAFIADEITEFKKDHDTTWALMKEAEKQGHEVYYLPDNKLGLYGADASDSPIAYGHYQKLDKDFFKFNEDSKSNLVTYPKNYTDKNPFRTKNLDDFEIIFMRKDPPVNSDYISITHILSLCKKALVINNPKALRDFNEKLVILNFPQLITNTLVSSSLDEIHGFLQEHKKIVVKPLDGMGGDGIFVLEEGDKNFKAIVESLFARGPVMSQKYIPEIQTKGDKRIIVINGEPLGIIRRVPKAGEHRANMAAGGGFEQCELEARDLEICSTIKEFLLENKIYFAGIDVIGDYLTEINITSPTCVQEIDRVNNLKGDKSLASRIVKSAVKMSPSALA